MAIEKGAIWGKLFGQILLEKVPTLTLEQLDEGLEKQKKTGKLIGEQLLELKYVKETELLEALSEAFGIPSVDPNEAGVVNADVVRLVPEILARKFKFLVVQVREIEDKATLFVAMADPKNINAIDTIKQITKVQEVQPVISLPHQIEKAIENFYTEGADLSHAFDELEGGDDVSLIDDMDGDGMDVSMDHEAAPVVKYVNSLFAQAVKEGASDMHIEPQEKSVSVRFRVDGKLHSMSSPPKKLQSPIISRIKVISGLDIAERRVPQDGRCKIRMMNRDIDIRVSTLPLVHGEKVVMRLLDKSATSLDIHEIGMEPDTLELAKKLITRPYGIILLCGPTGSGKTTTLYSFLNYVNNPDVNIVTVEDPVEYQLKGINQVAVRTQVGLTFALGLRSILRQDPDIIMVGEIRDKETLEMAIKASLTGHLVFSTLHTNNAVASVQRMINMGTEPFLIASTLTAAVSQRLVRKVCTSCKTIIKPEQELVTALVKHFGEEDFNFKFMAGRGCPNCKGTGKKGRTAVHELLFISSVIREMIVRGDSEQELTKQAHKEGMETIVGNAFKKVKLGAITIEECLSLIYDVDEI